MRDETIKMFEDFANTDFANQPNFIVMEAFYKRLCENGMHPADAVMVVGHMDIEVNENFIKDQELFERCVKAFVTTIIKMQYHCQYFIAPGIFEAKAKKGFVFKYTF